MPHYCFQMMNIHQMSKIKTFRVDSWIPGSNWSLRFHQGKKEWDPWIAGNDMIQVWAWRAFLILDWLSCWASLLLQPTQTPHVWYTIGLGMVSYHPRSQTLLSTIYINAQVDFGGRLKASRRRKTPVCDNPTAEIQFQNGSMLISYVGAGHGWPKLGDNAVHGL